MFYAYLLVCHMVVQGDCAILKDNRGPYPTIEKCHERVEEMAKHIIDSPLPYLPRDAQCEQEGTAT